ncbi:MAG: hypothetical protein PHN35_03090 [Clostridia bacterium]|nr:hypothetical protein [Clostridia bacterium]MDD4799006.1 hypothetical protein [Clostridia bacterium]
MSTDRVEIENILKELEDAITNASRIPLTGKVLVDGDMVLEFVDRIYAILPEELKQAKQVLDQSDKLLESMEGQGKRILDDARAQAEVMVSESEILKEAKRQAEALYLQAENEANILRRDAVAFADDLLYQVELTVDKATAAVKRSREDLRGGITAQ